MKDKRGYKVELERETKRNTYFRRVLYTTKNSQLVLMSLKPKEEIGAEVHKGIDQFFRFEQGKGAVVINGVRHAVKDGSAVIVPAGARHNVINTSSTQGLRFYTIYSPPDHKDKIVHRTRADAIANDKEFDGRTTE
ncbi:MAG: cupin domain-containing protein [Candidatus Micrarchaeaceae archaeon]|jgi:mannose-6-phosphate isomerase-like protein (cupin superfamily)|nr:cupin domain-containing protein [Candidatus Micrarchaeota archaeon]HII10336.1 cupin domain-containing protein [Candidatus Micrarchaeota archaeon]